MILLMSRLCFLVISMAWLQVVEGFFYFLLRLRLSLFNLSSFLAGSEGSAELIHGETDFEAFIFGFSGREKSLAAVP